MKIVLILLVQIIEIKNYIFNHKEIHFPKEVYLHFKIESGNFKSKLYKKTNNLAGIKYNKHGYCVGKYKSYAKYRKWQDCIEDYIRIQKIVIKKYKPKTGKQYQKSLIKYGYY